MAMVVIGWLGTAAALYWLLFGSRDPGSRLFAGLSVLVLALCSLYGSRARPRLAAGPAGIEVRGLRGVRRYGWAQVTDLRLLQTPALGRKPLTLEITILMLDPASGSSVPMLDPASGSPVGSADDEHLLIFSRLDLGADPRDVYDDLKAASAKS